MEKCDSVEGNENNANDSLSSLISIHYPGVVNDVSKMLETLGGIKTISMVHSKKNKQLELRWRPDDSFCKPTFGTRKPVVGLLLKIKFRKKKTEKNGTILACEPIGSITEEYEFCKLCDFQYLATSEDKCFYDEIVPQSLNPDWLNSDAPYFLPPVAFSKIDKMQNFNFRIVSLLEKKSNVIGRLRERRHWSCLTFDNPDVPTVPEEVPGINLKEVLESVTFKNLESLFQDRPIYSKNAIACLSEIPTFQLNLLLPCVAYYFSNGPWRSLWVRYGYDPRKDPKARIYQMLDFRASRLRKEGVKKKREVSFMNTLSKGGRNSVQSKQFQFEEQCQRSYIFSETDIPPSRQCYYQYCDIHVPEIKAMLENLDDVDESAVCHKVNGWMPPGFADLCRNIMNKCVSENLKEINEITGMVDDISLDTSIFEFPSSKYKSAYESDYGDSDELSD